jgi:nucleotide-binding universal stress UspA family protein
MNRILVPTDFSPCAKNAENVALDIARKTSAHLTFLHGLATAIDWVKLPKDKEGRYPEIKAQIGNAEQLLTERVHAAKEKGVEAEKSLVFLETYKTVASAVMDKEKEMIVMGSHGASELKKFIIGTNAGKILRSAKTPVLVVRKPLSSPVSFKTIVFASGLEPDTHHSFQRLLQFAQEMGAENLHLVEVITPHNFRPTGVVKAEMEAFAARHGHPNLHLSQYNHYSIEAGIVEFAQIIGADLIAIANHGRTDISSLFIESIPENLVKYSDYPVLSIGV